EVDPVVYATRKLGSSALLESRDHTFRSAYFNDSTLTPREREMIRMCAVYYGSCSRCSEARAERDLPGYSDQPSPQELYLHVLEWSTWPGYTEREQLAIEFCERYLLDYRDMCLDDGLWARLHAHFSETEIGDLCMLTGLWDQSMRQFHLLLGIEDGCK